MPAARLALVGAGRDAAFLAVGWRSLKRAAQIAGGERAIAAVMLEANLLGGAQDYQAKPLVYGRSITDACLAWEQTLPVLAGLAEAVQRRRDGGAR